MQTTAHSKIPIFNHHGIQPQTQPSTRDSSAESAVRECYERLMDGWNIGSAQAFADTFAEDGQLVGFDGTHLEGCAAIAAFQRPLFEKWLKGTRLVGKVKNVKILTPDLALVHAIGGTVMRGHAKADPARDSIQTLVMTKREGSWQVLAFQNTRLRPMGASAGSAMAWLIADGLWNLLRPRKRNATPRMW
jgi:uncharacterized protein (TIGR02246 family)